jgi:hypothetical protein
MVYFAVQMRHFASQIFHSDSQMRHFASQIFYFDSSICFFIKNIFIIFVLIFYLFIFIVMSKDFIPSKDADFAQWASNLMDYLGQKLNQYGITQNAYESVRVLYDQFAAAYALAENPLTRTSAAVVGKRETRTAFTAALRLFLKGNVTYNNQVGDVDRTNMGLPVYDSSHSPVPPPSTYPDMAIDSSVIRRLSVHYHDHGSNRRGKPAGVQGAIVRWGILENVPNGVEELPHSALDTRSPYTLDFEDKQRGSKVYFCLAWQNNKGEQGPWSEIECAIVP